MTSKEAIERVHEAFRLAIDKLPQHFDPDLDDYVIESTEELSKITEANKMACNALKKQIPMKPRNVEERVGALNLVWYEGECPVCGGIVNGGQRYCCSCSQAIDWKTSDNGGIK